MSLEQHRRSIVGIVVVVDGKRMSSFPAPSSRVLSSLSLSRRASRAETGRHDSWEVA